MFVSRFSLSYDKSAMCLSWWTTLSPSSTESPSVAQVFGRSAALSRFVLDRRLVMQRFGNPIGTLKILYRTTQNSGLTVCVSESFLKLAKTILIEKGYHDTVIQAYTARFAAHMSADLDCPEPDDDAWFPKYPKEFRTRFLATVAAEALEAGRTD